MGKYAIEFRTLAAGAGWDATALGDVFIHGVKDCLAAQDLPKELNTLIALAIQVDCHLWNSEREHQEERGEAVGGRWSEEPMQLGQTCLFEAEKKRRHAQGLCLCCGQSGHYAAGCPLKEQANQ